MFCKGLNEVVDGIKHLTGVANDAVVAALAEGARLQKQNQAKKAVREKLKRDPKQKEKRFVFTCWQEWQNSPERYSSKVAFSRDMLDKCDHLISNKKIEDWCREWEKPNPAS